MNDDILKMAREAWGEHHEIFWFNDDGIERFAALVAAAERETIIQAMPGGHSVDPQWVCDMIRARSNT